MSKHKHIDTIRLDRLADPEFKFVFSITAKNECNLQEPVRALCSSLRGAIDLARTTLKEQPACVRCTRPLNESNRTSRHPDQWRYSCPNCATSFNVPKAEIK